MRRHMRMLPVCLVAVIALILGAAAPVSWAKDEISLDAAEVFIEFNSTDQDFGIQFFWDGEAWKKMKVEGPDGKTVLKVKASRNLKAQGLTEGFFESAEPSVDELSMGEFLDRFPEGTYEFEGKTLEGDRLVGTAELTHDLPAAVSLEVPDPDEGEFPFDGSAFTIEWTDESEAGDPEIVGYEVVAEMVVEASEERVFVNIATLPAGVEAFTFSQEFADLADAFFDTGLVELKVEVIAIEASGNKTITEEAVFEADDE